MDLILLSHNAEQAENGSWLGAQPLRERLLALVEWLLRSCSSLDVYVFLPDRPGQCLELCRDLIGCGHVRVFGLVPAQRLDPELLHELDCKVLKKLFVTTTEQDQEPDILAHAAEVLTAYRQKYPRSMLKLGFWMASASHTSHFRSANFLERVGVRVATWGEAPFMPPSPAATLNLAPFQGPEGVSEGVHSCRLYSETLSVSADGAIRACPSDPGTFDGIDFGRLLPDEPETIVTNRGFYHKYIGKTALCSRCTLPGRFTWPMKGGQAISRVFEAGQELQSRRYQVRAYVPSDQFDLGQLSQAELQQTLANFETRLIEWHAKRKPPPDCDRPLISIETPVFKAGWLIPCIESVLAQTASNWTHSLVWDGGEELAKRILEILERLDLPQFKVYYQERAGIAKARRFLTQHSRGAWILTLDDDDLLTPDAVACFTEAAEERPWSGIIRARRDFVDAVGRTVPKDDWFPFEPRHYAHGMVTDLSNHSQPALIRRSAYQRTAGWEGFADFFQAGEDCDIFTKIEEVASIELLDRLLYHYRLNDRRASHDLGAEAANEMWRRLADKTIRRLGLYLERQNQSQPFSYRKQKRPTATLDQVEFVIPFWESHEQELAHAYSRPSTSLKMQPCLLENGVVFRQILKPGLAGFHRLEIGCSSAGPVLGSLELVVAAVDDPNTPLATARQHIDENLNWLKFIGLACEGEIPATKGKLQFTISFRPAPQCQHFPVLILLGTAQGATPQLMMRLFQKRKRHNRRLLDQCLQSLAGCGIAEEAIHIIDKRDSAAANRNAGFGKTHKPYVCFLDDDIVLSSPDVITGLLEGMESMQAELAGPKILDAKDRIFCADPFFNRTLMPIPRGLDEVDEGQFDYCSEVAWLPTTLLLIRREVFRAVGGFDEGYIGSQVEDADFCLRARQRNFTCAYIGSHSIVHFNQQRNYEFSKNFARFSRKWHSHASLFELGRSSARADLPAAISQNKSSCES